MANKQTELELWIPIIGRALAKLCLESSSAKSGTTAEKARFLESLGLTRKDVADMLGTTSASVTELLRQAKNRKKRV